MRPFVVSILASGACCVVASLGRYSPGAPLQSIPGTAYHLRMKKQGNIKTKISANLNIGATFFSNDNLISLKMS